MRKKRLKKLLLGFTGVFVLLAIVLFVHVYKVTHRKITDPNAIALARIDFDQKFTNDDAIAFYNWFSKQEGVNRVSINAENHNAILAYYPVKVDASKLIKNFSRIFSVNAKRYMPSKEEMMKGCPVAAN